MRALHFVPSAVLLSLFAVFHVGCGKSFGDFAFDEIHDPVATVPFELRYLRYVDVACVKLKGGCGYEEDLEIRSFACEGPSPGSCTVEAVEYERLLVTTTEPGAYRIRLAAKGLESGEELETETTVNVLASANVEIAADFGSPNGTFYDAVGVGGRIQLDVEMVHPTEADRGLAYRQQDFVWSIADVDPEASSSGRRLIQAGEAPSLEVSVSIGQLRGTARYDVLTPMGDERVRVLVDGEVDPESILLRDGTTGYVAYTALETVDGRRFPGGGDQLRIEGQGCVLEEREPLSFQPLPATAMREIVAEPGAICTLLVGRGAEQRAIPVSREPKRQ